MAKDPDPPAVERVAGLLDERARAEVVEHLDRFETAAPEERKAALQALRRCADEQPRLFGPILDALVPFLTDEERSVRLTTAKLFVAVAEADPDAVASVISPLADRLADEDEFYYVRARSAEALGYVALEHPEEAASPEILADLRIGLSFDEPEVKEKLAKALEYVALGNPDRLRHQVSSVAEHLDDGNELVRYHLTTALVAVGCTSPSNLADAGDALAARLESEGENGYTRGRAAEALGLLARAEPDAIPADGVPREDDEGESFVVERVHFARGALAGGESDETTPDGIGTVEAVRETTEEALAEITAPDGEGECPHCGLALPESGPPMCPRCGAPSGT
ncbi:HEAT repeat domain-containing protein (plasmid) [Haloferacaceae archaeon DSL9]